MRKLLVILMLFVFGQATVCLTAMYVLDHMELISMMDTASAGTMIEEEESDEDYSCNTREELSGSFVNFEESNLSYFNEQDYYLLPGFTDRVFSPPESVNC